MKASRKILIIVCSILILTGATVGGVMLHEHIQQRRIENMLEQERMEIIYAYIRLNYAFGRGGDPDRRGITESDLERLYEWSGRYQPAREVSYETNQWALNVDKYLILKFYEHETGVVLPYELVIDYHSEKFEPDGSLRLYNNGKHPEIEAFVTWMWEGRRREEARVFIRDLELIYNDYSFSRRDDERFRRQIFYQLSSQMLDALVRAYADPDYVLDLTSIQQSNFREFDLENTIRVLEEALEQPVSEFGSILWAMEIAGINPSSQA